MKRTLLASLIGASLCHQAFADPVGLQSARRIAMGSTGVASAIPLDASFSNPAMAAMPHQDENDGFALLIPGVSAGGEVDAELIDTIDDIQVQIDRFDNAVNSNNLNAARASALGVLNGLKTIDGESLAVNGNAGLAFMVPSNTLSVGAFVSGSVIANVTADVADNDLKVLETAIKADDISDLDGLTLGDDLESSGNILVLGATEAGITLATELQVAEQKVAVGITPKRVGLISYDYTASVSSFDEEDLDAKDYETESSGMTFDVGAATAFGAENEWRTGLAIRNLRPLDLDTVSGLTVAVERQATVGVARSTEWLTLAGDLDLNSIQTLEGGPESQYVSGGAEFDVFDVLQLRGGLRKNLAESGESALMTLGFGLNLLAVRLDLGVATNSDRTDGGLNLAVAF